MIKITAPADNREAAETASPKLCRPATRSHQLIDTASWAPTADRVPSAT
jgi:hypothetical protein